MKSPLLYVDARNSSYLQRCVIKCMAVLGKVTLRRVQALSTAQQLEEKEIRAKQESSQLQAIWKGKHTSNIFSWHLPDEPCCLCPEKTTARALGLAGLRQACEFRSMKLRFWGVTLGGMWDPSFPIAMAGTTSVVEPIRLPTCVDLRQRWRSFRQAKQYCSGKRSRSSKQSSSRRKWHLERVEANGRCSFWPARGG